MSTQALEIKCAELTESNAKLFTKVVDFEVVDSLQNNIRIIGKDNALFCPLIKDYVFILLFQTLKIATVLKNHYSSQE